MSRGAPPLTAGSRGAAEEGQRTSAASRGDAIRLGLALGALAAFTGILGPWLQVSNASIISTTYLMVVLVVAATSRLAIAVITSLVAMLCLNFYFLPPVGTFTIADPHNWVALFAFLAVSLVASNLSAVGESAHGGGARTPRRAGAPVRPEPRRADDDREP